MARPGPSALTLILTLCATIAPATVTSASAAEFSVTPQARDITLSLTLYPDGRSWVREVAPLQIIRGESILIWPAVPATLEPETLTARVLEGKAQIVTVTPPRPVPTAEEVMRRWIGEEIELVQADDKLVEKVIHGTLVGISGSSVMLLVKDRLWIDPPGSLRLPHQPALPPPGPEPAAILLSAPQIGGRISVEVSYRTTGLSWSPDYRAVRRGEQLDFEGWITMSNDTLRDFAGANVKLLAGEVRREAGSLPMALMERVAAHVAPMEAEPAPPPVSREALGATHLYTLARPADLPSGARTRLVWASRMGFPARPRYRLESAQGHSYGGDTGAPPRHPDTLMSVEAKVFDQPLPAGVVRVFESDAGGALQEVGEDRIEHLPAGAPFELRFGTAFDLLAGRTQTEQNPTGGGRGADLGCEITIRNAGRSAATVEVREQFHGRWKITDSSIPARRVDASTAEFLLPVPASGEASLTYRASVRY